MPLLWILLFFAVALIYASVGFGGGSTYTALLALWGVDYRIVPVVSLLCNIIVVTGGVIRFLRAGLYDWRTVLPLIAISAPLAFIGGLMPIKEATFYIVLGGALFLSSAALFVPTHRLPVKKLPQPAILLVSAAAGLLAGFSGIGGGIFMSPLLHLIRWSDARRIAAFASLYIFVNSVAGITGQLYKSGAVSLSGPMMTYWPLMLAVFVGGQLGGVIGLRILPLRYLHWITAIVVGYAALNLLWKGVNLA
jgi:uncharacterized protein